ncbi:unnamed protein product, partial [Didymodactylos carnosus]
FESELHDHSQRQENNRLKSPIRTAVQEMIHKGLTQGQIRKAVSVLHPNLTIDTKIKNVHNYGVMKELIVHHLTNSIRFCTIL